MEKNKYVYKNVFQRLLTHKNNIHNLKFPSKIDIIVDHMTFTLTWHSHDSSQTRFTPKMIYFPKLLSKNWFKVCILVLNLSHLNFLFFKIPSSGFQKSSNLRTDIIDPWPRSLNTQRTYFLVRSLWKIDC